MPGMITAAKNIEEASCKPRTFLKFTPSINLRSLKLMKLLPLYVREKNSNNSFIKKIFRVFWKISINNSITTAQSQNIKLPLSPHCDIVSDTLGMIKKIIILLVIIGLGAGIFFGARYFISNTQNQGQAGLYVKSNPPASIFLDTRFLGRTPYQEKLEPGEYTLKLIPESTATTAASWQGKITLQPNILTYVNRELGETDLTSSGEVVTLEKLSGKNTEISVNTVPDGASVKIDNEDKGTAPVSVKNIEPGEHEIVVSSPGFITRAANVKATIGFKLIATIQLGIGQNGTVKEQPKDTTSEDDTQNKEDSTTKTSATTPQKPYVEVLNTPTGWLRVRLEPSLQASETARVNPKETYPLLDEQSGWYKIKLSNSEGWISSTYAKKYE